MKKIVLISFILFSIINKINAQNTNQLDDYQYVVVPLDYDFLGNEKNKFLLNSLTKHLLNQRGFETYIETDPKLSGLELDRCLGLYADVTGTPMEFFSMKTETQLILKDCEGNVIFKSLVASSKLKDFEKAYKDALKEAFESFGSYVHRYNGKQGFYEKRNAAKSKTPEKSTALDKASHFTFMRGETPYEIEAISAGFLLKEKNSGKRIAHLHYTNTNTILYNSDEINGTATFTDAGNLLVEYFDKESEQLKHIEFTRKGVD
ncbi:hypothetical protein [Mesonia maritima]|uniref:Uncharacterized protein n=1 Tax=Mesonia maritima TaxID=1793873 RepID=A0ABU1K6Y9_9FLAO|nr:hypothetical protein [Mesonia maritima]MDR6301361.1 hypothetical protein [Mesonia maritima]